VVVAPVAYTREQLEGQKIGVPGLRTTAYLVLRLLIPNFEAVVIPVAPFRRAFNALSSGEVSAALLIHEGRLLYEREGLKLALDIGEAWQQLTGLPLPLGGNVIARSLGPELIAKVSDVLRESIRYALENRDEVLAALVGSETREGVPKEPALFDRYLSMYANQDTLDYGEIGRKAIAELYERAFEGGLIPERVNVEYAP
jgi:1,4-dihydroxy-6-naphthoate synthase